MLTPVLLIGAALLLASSKKKPASTDDTLDSIVRETNEALATLPPDYTASQLRGASDITSSGITIGATMQEPIYIGFRRGHCVGVHRSGARASVKLRDVAGKMKRKGQLAPAVSGEDLMSYLDVYDDRPGSGLHVGAGKIAKKLGNAVKKVAAVAKKVVNNKVVKAIGGMVTKMLPPPISTGFAAVQMGVSVAKKIAGAVKGSKTARAAPIVSDLAAGKITRPQAEARSRLLGVNPEAVVNTGVALKLRADAQRGNPQARALFAVHERVQQAGQSPQAAQQAVQMIRTAAPQQPSVQPRRMLPTTYAQRPGFSSLRPGFSAHASFSI